jgi:hypothetical protein
MARLRYGVAKALEEEANAILADSLRTARAPEKMDILTPWKEQQRRRREIFVASGVPDPATRLGMFHRRTNPTRPHLNSRDGVTPPRMGESHRPESSLSSFVHENLFGDS